MALPNTLLLGPTGTIGRAVLKKLAERDAKAVALVRPESEGKLPAVSGISIRASGLDDAAELSRIFAEERIEGVISCLASRTGAPKDAWAVDHAAHSRILAIAKDAGVARWVQLSAICVQKPLLAFQHAKLAFEKELVESGLDYSIVRPTAFFKSLSGQADRVKAGKKFLVFGDGALTACKPISDEDLATFILDCLDRDDRRNQILSIGGPGPALTPIEQGQLLADALGVPLKTQSVPVRFLSVIITALSAAGAIAPPLREKAELAKIGRYYATESMLVWDDASGVYDADATPEFGADTLAEHYVRLARGEADDDRGDHAVF